MRESERRPLCSANPKERAESNTKKENLVLFLAWTEIERERQRDLWKMKERRKRMREARAL